MEESHSFEPSLVISVGLDDATTASLQDECAERRIRLLTAREIGDLPISLKCDVAIVAALLPDGDGRALASDFARAGAKVLLLDTGGSASLADAWSYGASAGSLDDDPATWLDELARPDHVDAVSRAGHLHEPLALALAVESAASFAGSTGVSVSFVTLTPKPRRPDLLGEALDRLTSIVGMTTVFHDTPQGGRFVLVLNGDRRRLTRLLDDEALAKSLTMGVVEVNGGDSFAAVLGRSRLAAASIEAAAPKVLVALAPGREKLSETIRAALHRLEIGTISWDSGLAWDDLAANPPLAAIVDAKLANGLAAKIVEAAAKQTTCIPSLAIDDSEQTDDLQGLIKKGISDFLLWPFASGDLQAALARTITLAPVIPETAPETAEDEAAEPLMEPDEAAIEEAEDIGSTADSHEVDDAVPEEPETPDASGVDAFHATGDGAVSEEETPHTPPARPPIESVLVEVIAEKLISGQALSIEGVGVLRVQHETSRIVHDPDGRTIVEPPRRSLRFDPIDPNDDA